MKCVTCGGQMSAPYLSDRPYLGLPGLTLGNLTTYTCETCGGVEWAIPNLGGLVDFVETAFSPSRAGRPSLPARVVYVDGDWWVL